VAERFSVEFAPHHYRGPAWQHKLAHLVDRLGDYSLAAITPPLVAKYRDARLADADPRYKNPRTAPTVSASTVKTEIDLLSKLLDWAQKECAIALPAGNPVKSVRKPRDGPPRNRRLSQEEWIALQEQCAASANVYLRAAVTLAVETAMRQGELLGLHWKDIDRSRRLALLLDPAKIKTEEPRAVPLSTSAMKALESVPRSLDGRIFPLQKTTLYKSFQASVRRAGIVNYTWHDLRHEALSRLAERGDLSVLEIAAVSGHKTLQMLKRYTHLQAESLAKKLG
jgi:integrase